MLKGRLIPLASAVLATAFLPCLATAQTTHARAKAQVEARDAKHHNKLKTEGIPTATGAVAGAAVAGPPGALMGAQAGHGVGTVVHGVKKHHDIKQVENRSRRRHRTVHTVR